MIHNNEVTYMSRSLSLLLLATTALGMSACSSSQPLITTAASPTPMDGDEMAMPDPRIGLRAGLFDAEEAIWNLNLLSSTPPSDDFVGVTNSDLAFTGPYAIQGNYNGIQVWDISNPVLPTLVTGYVCPASQSDVSVAHNLMFVSGEGLGGRLDCGTEGVSEAVSPDRLRGIRIFDISDIRNPVYIHSVQTCRGSHTHTLLEDPDDPDNVYIYVSGSSRVRSAEELPGCVSAAPSEDPNSALFRIEVIRVPLAHPEQAEIVSSPRIFQDLVAPPRHGASPADIAAIESARVRGAFIAEFRGQERVLPDRMILPLLDSIVLARGGSGTPTGADSAALREYIPTLFARFARPPRPDGPRPGPSQCHDITVYPAIGLAGGACGGYGLLLDISDPANPVRIGAVADSNFSFWHSATFNNDGTKILFSDEWGGGGQPKCRVGDPREWGANAIFAIENREMVFHTYYKLPVPQTALENCVAHNGSLIPIPGRDVMVQAWYQGGISVFDWTDASNPFEIAFHDRGPSDSTRMGPGGSWSVYWYNGVMVSSEIARGLDIFELVPSEYLSANEIEAAKSVQMDHFNAQSQPHFEWPATFALSRAYVDQLERSGGLSADRISGVRQGLTSAERASGAERTRELDVVMEQVRTDARGSSDRRKVRLLMGSIRRLVQSM